MVLIHLLAYPLVHVVRYLNDWLGHFNLLEQFVGHLMKFPTQRSLKKICFGEVVMTHWNRFSLVFLSPLFKLLIGDIAPSIIVIWTCDCLPFYSEFCEAATDVTGVTKNTRSCVCKHSVQEEILDILQWYTLSLSGTIKSVTFISRDVNDQWFIVFSYMIGS